MTDVEALTIFKNGMLKLAKYLQSTRKRNFSSTDLAKEAGLVAYTDPFYGKDTILAIFCAEFHCTRCPLRDYWLLFNTNSENKCLVFKSPASPLVNKNNEPKSKLYSCCLTLAYAAEEALNESHKCIN